AVARPAADRVQVWVEAPADGWLLLAEQAYPGWRAAVDGEPAPVYIAEYALMAVPVPAGAHTVTWVYRPAWWPGVGWVSLLGGALLAALAYAPRRDARPSSARRQTRRAFLRPGPTKEQSSQ
ncbi:MAG: YfhO family protein, partial [Chloroflexi bacterium]|nr:YfhO family protein [Chloroflexota bacterium]